MSRLPSMLSAALCAVLSTYPGSIASAQTFGGSPPWGSEKPTSIRGEVSRGKRFESPIGDGLSLTLAPQGDEWVIEIGPSRGGDDYSDCVNPPFHGPNPIYISAWDFTGDGPTEMGGVGRKRWVDFVLTSADRKTECENMDIALQEKESAWGSHITGRCWLRPLSVKLSDGPPSQQLIESLEFEAECALHGAWELWRLPATYVLPDEFSGWVTVYYRQKGRPELPRRRAEYLVEIGEPPAVYTSSDLRQDSRGAKYGSKSGKAYATNGPDRMIWGWQAGDASLCSPFQSFFVGTREQYRKSGPNPALKNSTWDCSKVIRVER